MKHILILISFAVCGIASINAQNIFRTETFNKSIKTLLITPVSDAMITSPYINLNSDEQIEISFDVINHEGGQYSYSLIHCNSDWTQSTMQPMEYMTGFQNTPIYDYEISNATTVNYTNHRILIPNGDTQIKLSGNYAMQVFADDQPEKPVLTACFSVVDNKIDIMSSVSSSTNIDFNDQHQQVSFIIDHRDLAIRYPETELKVQVMQNQRRDSWVTNILPTRRDPDRLIYEHNSKLIFPAGNEYRRIEFLSHRYNGMGTENTSFHNPFYHVSLYEDTNRSQLPYSFDQDQNGRYFINSSGASDPSTQADYNIVHFSLDTPPILDGQVHLSGEFMHNNFGEDSRMNYNFETNKYEKALLLKQGLYNYIYLVVPTNQTKGETQPIEGNNFRAENEYTILVYYRAMGGRHDELIGINQIQFK